MAVFQETALDAMAALAKIASARRIHSVAAIHGMRPARHSVTKIATGVAWSSKAAVKIRGTVAHPVTRQVVEDASAKVVFVPLTNTAAKQHGMKPVFRNAPTIAVDALEKTLQEAVQRRAMDARRATVPDVEGVPVSSVFALWTHTAATTCGMTSVCQNAQRTATDAAWGVEEVHQTDVPPRNNPVVWIASAKPVFATRTLTAATTHGTKYVSENAKTAAAVVSKPVGHRMDVPLRMALDAMDAHAKSVRVPWMISAATTHGMKPV